MESSILLNGLVYTVECIPEKMCSWIGRGIVFLSNFITCYTFIDRVRGATDCCCKKVNVHKTVNGESSNWYNVINFMNKMSHYGSAAMETTTIGTYLLWNKSTYLQLTNNDTNSIEWVLIIPSFNDNTTITLQGPHSIVHGIMTTNWAGKN
jgi:hypothetical protein